MMKMKKLTVAMIAALTVTAAFTSTATVFASGYNRRGNYIEDGAVMEVQIDAGYLALRNAAEYTIESEIGELGNGDIVRVHNYYGGEFVEVEVPSLNDRVGYVSANCLVDF